MSCWHRSKMVKVRWTAQEKQVIEELAISRGRFKVTSKKVSSYSEHELNRFGVIGEMAAARALGCRLNRQTRPHGGWDTYLPDGRSLDARYHHMYDAVLSVGGPSDLLADIAVLVVPDKNEPDDVVWVVGWITRDEFYRWMKRRNWGYGVRNTVGRTRLHSIEELVCARLL